jgi:hypothetical protein
VPIVQLVFVHEILVMKTLVIVEVNIFVQSVGCKHIVMKISIVVDMTLGPAVRTEALNVPVDKHIMLWRLLVEVHKPTNSIASLPSLGVIVVLVLYCLIEADSMSPFVGEWSLFLAVWPEPGNFVLVNPHELISQIDVCHLVSLSRLVNKVEPLFLVVL